MHDPLEISVQHRCHLGRLVDELAEHARLGERGEHLAERGAPRSSRFSWCEISTNVASRSISPWPRKVFERVLLWPIGPKDAQQPHAEGCAVFAAVRGKLIVHY